MAVLGLLSIVPLCTWAATGSWRSAMHSLRGYLLCMGILAGLALVGGLVGYSITLSA